MTRHLAAALLALGMPAQLHAQVERYDLGRKLRAFEQAWDAHPEPAARRRAMPELKKAVPFLLAGRGGDAARTLDETRFLLRRTDAPSAAERWAAALVARPAGRLLDPADG